jgi:hypothetical protein
MDRHVYRVEETSIDRGGAATGLAQLINEANDDWELFSIDHLRDEGANAVFLVVWRQSKPFGDLAEEG